MDSQRIILDKIPPQNIEAEQSVIGAMLIEQEAINKVVEILDETCFYKEVHKNIFKAIISLYEKNEAVDLITLTESLTKKGELELIGGATYIEELIDTVPIATNVEYYAKIVKEKATLRMLIDASTKIIQESYSSSEEVDILLDKAENSIFSISQHKSKKGFVSIKDFIHSSMEKIETVYHGDNKVSGLATGFEKIDEITSGFQSSDLIIVAGRPSMGKSSLCHSIAQNVAIRDKKGVAIFSLEMSTEQTVMRMLCSEARVDSYRVRAGKLFESDWPKLTIAAGLLAEAPIYIDDNSETILEIRAKTRRLLREVKGNISVIIIDYLQQMHARGRAENRQQEITEISRSLKVLAKELNIPIIVVSQLSRALEQRKEDPTPKLSDLRESGAIEQDADLVMFIYKDRKQDEKSVEVDIKIAKHRNGPLGNIKLAFVKEYTRFENLTLHFDAKEPE